MLYSAAMGASNALLPKFVVDNLGGSATTAGAIVAALALSSLLARGWFGRLGEKLLIVIGCVVTALSMLILVVSDSVLLAVVARLVAGIGQAAAVTGATVRAIAVAPDARRGEAASYIFVAFHLGLALGPVAGETLVSAFSYHVAWTVLGLIALCGASVAAALPHRPGDRFAPVAPWIHRQALLPGTIFAFSNVGFAAFTIFVPLYAREVGLDRVGLVFTVASLTLVVVRVVFGRVPDRIGPVRSGSIALGVTAFGAVVAAAWHTPTGIFVAAAALSGGIALQTPSLIPVAVRVAPHERASAMATFTLFMDLSTALTGPVFGLIVSGLGYSAAFAAAGVFAMIALVILHVSLAPRWRAVSAALAPSVA
jgi:MFS family permease